jgi:pimeloyl-ACP methyl ester carboxylesterase
MLYNQEFGSKDGAPFFYFHGFPGSHVEGELLHDSALRLNLRVIAVDRPGYGKAPAQPGRALLAWPEQIAQLANQLGLEQFGVIGISGGGPYALACAYGIPERLTRVCVVCGLGPLIQTHLVYAMSRYARHVFKSASQEHWRLLKLYSSITGGISKYWPEGVLWLLARYLGGGDEQVLSLPNVVAVLSRNLRTAFAQDHAGVKGDLAIYSRPWGFSLSEIRLPLVLWHGDNDRIVPLAHSEYIHREIKNSNLNIIPAAGHFSLPIAYCEQILQDLI